MCCGLVPANRIVGFCFWQLGQISSWLHVEEAKKVELRQLGFAKAKSMFAKGSHGGRAEGDMEG
jgi:hypothetical protein